MKKPRSPNPTSATSVADTQVSTATATGDGVSSSTDAAELAGENAPADDTGDGAASSDTAVADAGGNGAAMAATNEPAVSPKEPSAVDEIAARAGIAADQLLAWQWRGERGLYVVTIDGRKIVVDGDPEGAR